MTIFRSKARKFSFFVSNHRTGGFGILTEPWAKEFSLHAGDKLKVECEFDELTDLNSPLNIEIWDDVSGASIWCPANAELTVLAKEQ
jgi:hypothetical protein